MDLKTEIIEYLKFDNTEHTFVTLANNFRDVPLYRINEALGVLIEDNKICSNNGTIYLKDFGILGGVG